ncbi:MAG: AMP-binding protein [Actinophytocola sp.]|uniref:AMP-binding protein n=1 Tax=Actinophytocola sp. TaxID=1872138 RepID=UPI001324E7C4|nr:AMP-binding protein [Actinophytocola sp.]MPZ83195.1 AMP-binding protein [Actinophytocola sp.]
MQSQPAVHAGGEVRSVAEVHARTARVASALRTLGIAHGDRYAVVLRNQLEYLEVSLAGAAVGGIPVPVNWHWTGKDLRHLLHDSGSKVVFSGTELLPAVEANMPAGTRIVEIATSAAARSAYQLDPQPPTGRYPTLEGLIGEHEPIGSPVTEPPMAVIYTSGTTGTPKGIVRQPMTPEQGQRLAESIAAFMVLEPGGRTLEPAPLYHTAPNVHATFAVKMNMDLHIMPKFDPVEFLRIVQDEKIEHAIMVPAMFVRLLKLPDRVRKSYDVSSLRAVVHASAPCPPEVKRAMIDWLGPIVYEFYGASETGAVTFCDTQQWLAHPGTVGAPLLDAGIRVLDRDDQELSACQQGTIHVKPFTGWPDFTYLGDDNRRQDIEVDGYVSIGDIGYLDESGFLHLTDRQSDLVISGGVNVYPAEIENCLITMPGVADVAVVGIPDDDFGEVLAAHVQREPGATLTEQDIRAHVATQLARYKIPRVVVFDDRLPREDTGKLFKRRIRETYWRAQATRR